MINNEYMSQSVFDSLNEIFNKLKDRINNDSNYIQLNNITLAKLGVSTTSYIPLNSRIFDFNIDNKGFNEIYELIEEMKKIAKDQSETINNQTIEFEKAKQRESNKIVPQSPLVEKSESAPGELSTEGVFDEPNKNEDISNNNENLNDGIHNIF